MDKQADNPLDDFFCFSIYSAGLALNRFYKPLLDKLGLTYLQYLLLVLLRERDDQTVSGIGDQLFLESSTLTPLIKRMESAGLVSRRRDTKDERVVRVSLTESGKALAQEATCIPMEVFTAMEMPLDDIREAEIGFKKLRDQMFKAAR
ncbi:MAG: MarR family transcriptional regulator [Sphingomonadales bacterium]|nr:MarR family transcriptional regulator [Sphingomonadales bacterium]MDE2168538.1 MarR family transcriptional regulator [Sphingomonadales bacterium]